MSGDICQRLVTLFCAALLVQRGCTAPPGLQLTSISVYFVLISDCLY